MRKRRRRIGFSFAARINYYINNITICNVESLISEQ